MFLTPTTLVLFFFFLGEKSHFGFKGGRKHFLSKTYVLSLSSLQVFSWPKFSIVPNIRKCFSNKQHKNVDNELELKILNNTKI